MKEKKSDLILAIFWRYGYWICLLFVLWKCGTRDNGLILFGGGVIVYAVYSIIISIIPARHFLLGMLDVEHSEMRLVGSGYNKNVLKRWRRETWVIALFFIVMGILLIVL